VPADRAGILSSLTAVARGVAVLPALRLTVSKARIGRAAVSRDRDGRVVLRYRNVWPEDEEQGDDGKCVAHTVSFCEKPLSNIKTDIRPLVPPFAFKEAAHVIPPRTRFTRNEYGSGRATEGSAEV
jgi:hypothetical protein